MMPTNIHVIQSSIKCTVMIVFIGISFWPFPGFYFISFCFYNSHSNPSGRLWGLQCSQTLQPAKRMSPSYSPLDCLMEFYRKKLHRTPLLFQRTLKGVTRCYGLPNLQSTVQKVGKNQSGYLYCNLPNFHRNQLGRYGMKGRSTKLSRFV